ncbi:LysR family transcriptional regulator [Buchananella hordeovulneris]|uniref:LysR substrate-binding domain-containing protein n=1 Tax=Buchananella hordeovulneris TaxID=52770 RepID=UPI000F5E70D1|nr:LysR substrate-binding domain-containing protein [Buchananella hordeovulneris]RRD53310.1 LysR family transcriptional regulator [Buchananella hordeovulneris]
MELQQMRYAVAVAEERNFTRAAERCFVVQSALSHQIKALEREIGIQLFARTSRRVELTPAGEAFVRAARQSLAAAERAVTDAAAATGQIQGALNIGVIPTVTAVDVPHLLAAFHSKHPAVRIALRTGGSEKFLSDIHAGQLDVAFLGLAECTPPQRVATQELSREALVAVLPAAHPLTSSTRVTLEDLANERFVDFPSGTAGRAQTDLAFSAVGLQREVAFEAMSIDLILGLIRNGMAAGLLSAHVVPADHTLAAITVKDAPRRVEYLAWNDFNPSPATTAFLDAVALHLSARAEHCAVHDFESPT